VLLSLVKETATGDDIELTVQMSTDSAANVINSALSLLNAWKEEQFNSSVYKDTTLKIKLDELEEALKTSGVFAAFKRKPQKEQYL
jgi:hypothetical protein